MSKQPKAPRSKYRIRHLFGDDRESLLVYKRQGNIARERLASVPEWRSRKVHAAGIFINHNRAVTKRLRQFPHLGRDGVFRGAENAPTFYERLSETVLNTNFLTRQMIKQTRIKKSQAREKPFISSIDAA